MKIPLLAWFSLCAFATFVYAQPPPEGAPLSKRTLERLLLIDGVLAGERIVTVGDRGAIIFSDDGGESWRRAQTPTAPFLTAVYFVDQKTGWAVGHDSVILATTDGGTTWMQQYAAADKGEPLLDVLFLKPNRGFAVGAYGAFLETGDGGKTWSARKLVSEDKHLNALVKINEDKLLLVGEAGTLLLSEDTGQSWRALASPYKGSLFGAVVAQDGALVVFGLRGKLFRSTDLGRSWEAIANTSPATLMGGSKLADGALVIAGAAGVVLLSRDNGKTFTSIATASTKAYSTVFEGLRNALVIVGETGVTNIQARSVTEK